MVTRERRLVMRILVVELLVLLAGFGAELLRIWIECWARALSLSICETRVVWELLETIDIALCNDE